jgi:hypothetical protein
LISRALRSGWTSAPNGERPGKSVSSTWGGPPWRSIDGQEHRHNRHAWQSSDSIAGGCNDDRSDVPDDRLTTVSCVRERPFRKWDRRRNEEATRPTAGLPHPRPGTGRRGRPTCARSRDFIVSGSRLRHATLDGGRIDGMRPVKPDVWFSKAIDFTHLEAGGGEGVHRFPQAFPGRGPL